MQVYNSHHSGGLEIYHTHDNGGRPFSVVIDKIDNAVNIYKQGANGQYREVPTLVYHPQKVFIGDSPLIPMTEFSDGHGPAFYGNSFLLEISEKEYVFIGANIFSFNSLHPIVTYVSPVGNNDVPYPYAVDTENNHYLLIENVIVKNVPQDTEDPYDYYYRAYLITPDMAYSTPQEPFLKEFQGITQFYIGDDEYTFQYSPKALAEYNRLRRDFDGEPSVIKNDGKQYVLDRRQFAKLMRDFGEAMGFKPLPRVRILRRRVL